MNNYIENISDLIYLFIDGETNKIEQQTLFKELANNDELQTEFQQAVLMSKDFMKDRAVLTPAASLKDSIFLKAGLSAAGAAVATGVVSSGYLGRIFELFSKFSSQIYTVLVSSFATALVMLSLINPLLYKENDSNYALNNKSNKTEKNPNILLNQSANEANKQFTLPNDIPVSRVNTSKINK